jgi:hypothetical protein
MRRRRWGGEDEEEKMRGRRKSRKVEIEVLGGLSDMGRWRKQRYNTIYPESSYSEVLN